MAANLRWLVAVQWAEYSETLSGKTSKIEQQSIQTVTPTVDLSKPGVRIMAWLLEESLRQCTWRVCTGKGSHLATAWQRGKTHREKGERQLRLKWSDCITLATVEWLLYQLDRLGEWEYLWIYILYLSLSLLHTHTHTHFTHSQAHTQLTLDKI